MRTAHSLNTMLERAVVKTALLTVAAATWLGVAAVGQAYNGPSELGITDSQLQVVRPTAPGSARSLIEKHDCWTGRAPADMAGKLPGHAVVSFRNLAPAYVGTNGVGPALEHVFEARHPEITVHAFCR